jgi:chromosome partitioning protein
MPKIITLAHQKGGVGKTTLTLNLAYSMQEQLNIAVIDLDIQGSISQLKPLIENVSIDIISGIDLNTIQSLPYDVVIIDTPPYLSSELPAVFNVSDLVIIPTKAGLVDLLAIRATIALLKKAKEERSNLVFSILFNMVKNNSTITAEIKELIDAYQTPVLSTRVSDKISFVRSIGINKGIYATDDHKSKEEIDELTNEIINLLK